MTWYLVLRLVNIGACIVCLMLLSRSGYAYYRHWNEKTRVYWWALVGWTLLALEGTIEIIIEHQPPGPRTVFQTLVLAWMLRALTLQEVVVSRPPERPDEDKHKEEHT